MEVPTSGLKRHMRAIGSIIRWMDRAKLHGKMGGFTRVHMFRTKWTDLEYFVGLMGEGMREIGRKGSSMAKQHTFCQTASRKWENGVKVKRSNGRKIRKMASSKLPSDTMFFISHIVIWSDCLCKTASFEISWKYWAKCPQFINYCPHIIIQGSGRQFSISCGKYCKYQFKHFLLNRSSRHSLFFIKSSLEL